MNKEDLLKLINSGQFANLRFINTESLQPKEPIYELNENNMERINSLTQAMNTIRARMFVVASVDENGYFSMAASPAIHASLTLAKAEARRLAKLTPGKMYVPMQLAGGEMLPKSVNFISV